MSTRARLREFGGIRKALALLPRPARPDERIAGAARAMEADLSRPWRNPELARAAHMATNAFIRKFREVMGTTPQAFLMTRRLDRVRIMLEHTDLSVEAIADESGFSSRSHLATVFAKRFNTPPGAYRRMMREAIARG
jgi:transcriptional regulator GlxA family with amidase domain